MNDPHTTSPNTSPPIAGSPAAVREVWSEFYTDEEIAAMGDALVREDVVDAARRLRAYHAQRRAAADPAQPPAQHPPVAEAEPERSAGPPTDHAEAADRGAVGDAGAAAGRRHPAPARPAAGRPVVAESRDHTGRATQHGGVDEFEVCPRLGRPR